MHRGLIGRKLGMSSLFSPEGQQVPVTVLEIGPCVVTQIKTQVTDGYNALQVGFLPKKTNRVNKPMQGHFKKSGGQAYAFVREIAVDDPSGYTLGQALSVDMFRVGELVDISGLSKGRGFAGVIKRWGFRGGKGSHGSMFHRAPGSIGASATPSKVIKGRKLPGHYGNRRVTVRNLEVVDIRPEENLLIVKGAVPGCRSGLVEVRKPKFSGQTS
ncbi:MAG: 50S ribosomal protein L3 [Deltaproteobacteria bacterium]|nr:50S ribosomal protein L3 [Deltaproteobacteria bacterium]MBW2074260.1 50S ribosomal protein L3 [Deltaproteobacteria bacterium]RLB81105.1 MAG: 50S ribosomal protein L3 [Deltaproteobacteria bacterium]